MWRAIPADDSARSINCSCNVCVALEACCATTTRRRNQATVQQQQQERDRLVKQIIESVGLDYAKDGPKRPSELSGGMARRASFAIQLAQRNHVIVLDEPFVGLDRNAAIGDAKEHMRLRRE
jgi:ABC-type transporter Mla maintaining outer membrane lipid asymmetry ATPase subunit MlaF